MHLTPITDDADCAREWFNMFEGAGLDGVVCKPVDAPYTPGKRIIQKVKHVRTADVVVAAWRPYKNPAPDGSEIVGALLLGLYDDNGVLHNVGAAGAFSREMRIGLAKELAAIEVGTGLTNTRGPGAPRKVSAYPACSRGGAARRTWDSIL